jgi:integrase
VAIVAQGDPTYGERIMRSRVDAAAGSFALIGRWLAFLELTGRCNPATRTEYRRAVVAFLADTLTDLRTLSEDDVITWHQARSPQGGGPAATIKALRSFYSWYEAEARGANPMRRIPLPRSVEQPVVALSPEELASVIAAAGQLPDRRARPTLLLAYHTGGRVGSLCAVGPKHIRFDRENTPILRFEVAKGGAGYEVPLVHPEAVDAVLELIELLQEGYKPRKAYARRPTLVGVGEAVVWQWASKAGEIAGVHAFPHRFRHTFGSRLAEDPDVDLRTWVESMNHRDGRHFRRYAQATTPRMKAARARLPAAMPEV